LVFSVADRWGRTVDATTHRWNGYVLRKRPQFAGREQLVIEAIRNPRRVLQGNSPNAKEFWGAPLPGQGFYFGGVSVVAIVVYPLDGSNGMLVTAYTAVGSPPGIQLWP
jgi:hypothetical protein